MTSVIVLVVRFFSMVAVSPTSLRDSPFPAPARHENLVSSSFSAPSPPVSSRHDQHHLPLPPDPARLHRQRSFFTPSCCCFCTHHRFCDPDFLPPALKDCLLYPPSVTKDDDPNHGNLTWWQDSWKLLGSRRKIETTHAHWTDDAVMADEPYYRPPRWRLFLRKIRAQTRKMNCSKPAPPGFHYDSLSYAMNFDDGCWHQGDSQPQAARFSGPILMESVSFKGSS